MILCLLSRNRIRSNDKIRLLNGVQNRLLIFCFFFMTTALSEVPKAQQTVGRGHTARASDTTSESSNSDDVYILLDEISMFSCRSVKNEIKLTEDDVEILNEHGNKAYYIKAPGNYTLNLKRINVLNNFGHLSGEIGITLQVPILEGPAGIRFDVPYTMVPETGLLSQNCDSHSGIVERDKRQYCRYCELCNLSEKIEESLNKEGHHQFLPRLAEGKEAPFSPRCEHINAKSYEFKRTISLPGRSELESKIRQKFDTVDNEIRKRLNKGKGRFQVFLNLISAEQPPISQKAWFDGSEQCRCCGKDRDPSCRSVLSFLYCNVEDCKSAWAQQCLHNSAKIVACYTIEFNYRMTVKRGDVADFLRENNYPDQEQEKETTTTTTTEQTSHHELQNNAFRVMHNDGSRQEISIQCVAQMQPRLTHLRRYCMIFWNEKLCCPHCEKVCRPLL